MASRRSTEDTHYQPPQQSTCTPAPARHVPPELLGEIFGWVIPSAPLDRYGRKKLLALVLVCKAWRNAAYLAHQLWANLDLTITRLPPYDHITNWFRKAGALGKALHLSNPIGEPACVCHLPVSKGRCSFQDPILIKLLAVGPPLKSLELGVISPGCYGNLMRTLEVAQQDGSVVSWNRIQTLEMYLTGRPRGNVDELLHSLPPNLTSLTLVAQQGIEDVKLDIPESVLKSLRFFDLSCHWPGVDVLSTLRHCTDLRTLHLRHRACVRVANHAYLNWTPGPGASDLQAIAEVPIVHLPHVQILDVDLPFAEEGSQVLGILRFPALKHLRAHYTNDRCRMPRALWNLLSALRAVGTANYPRQVTLRTLTIYDLGAGEHVIDGKLLVDILADLRSLREFALEAVSFDARQFLKDVRRREKDGAPKLLPRLRRFQLTHPVGEFDLESFFKWVKERRTHKVHRRTGHITMFGPPNSLKQIDLTFFSNDYDLLRACRQSTARQQLADSFGVSINQTCFGERDYDGDDEYDADEWDYDSEDLELGDGIFDYGLFDSEEEFEDSDFDWELYEEEEEAFRSLIALAFLASRQAELSRPRRCLY